MFIKQYSNRNESVICFHAAWKRRLTAISCSIGKGKFRSVAPWQGQHNDALPYPRVLPDCLSAQECANIVALGEQRLISAASVEGRSDLPTSATTASAILPGSSLLTTATG